MYNEDANNPPGSFLGASKKTRSPGNGGKELAMKRQEIEGPELHPDDVCFDCGSRIIGKGVMVQDTLAGNLLGTHWICSTCACQGLPDLSSMIVRKGDDRD